MKRYSRKSRSPKRDRRRSTSRSQDRDRYRHKSSLDENKDKDQGIRESKRSPARHTSSGGHKIYQRSPSPLAKRQHVSRSPKSSRHDDRRRSRSRSPVAHKNDRRTSGQFSDSRRDSHGQERQDSPPRKTITPAKTKIGSPRNSDAYAALRSAAIPDISLHERFRNVGENPRYPMKAEEQITVGIQRKVRGTPVKYVDHSYDPSCVVIHRRKDEGQKPIFEREEIINANFDESEDEGERRIIRVIKSDHGRLKYDDRQEPVVQDRRDCYGASPSSRHPYRDEDLSQRQSQHSMDIGIGFNPVIHVRDDITGRSFTHGRSDFGQRKFDSVEIHRRLGPMVGIGPGDGQMDRDRHRDLGRQEVHMETVPANPNDLRYNLMSKRRQSSSRREDDFDNRRMQTGGRRFESLDDDFDTVGPSELRGNEIFVRDDRRSTVTVIQSSQTKDTPGRNRDNRMLSIEDRLQEDMPKFSERPDKGKFEEWKLKPEMIPKGGLYYEHDNRDDPEMDYWDRRGRGRGFRGRGWFRGSRGFRGGFRGGRGSGFDGRDRNEFDSWKHDLFDKMEDDNKPTSTTEVKAEDTEHRHDDSQREHHDEKRHDRRERDREREPRHRERESYRNRKDSSHRSSGSHRDHSLGSHPKEMVN